MTNPSRLGRAAAALALLLPVTGCAGGEGGETPPSRSTVEHNDADVDFASDLIQHHAQALSMVDLVADRPVSSELEALAEEIRSEHGPQIEIAADWLEDWDEEIPPTMRDHVNAGHHDGDLADALEGLDLSDLPGALTVADFTTLEHCPDQQFEQIWLELMSKHHRGALDIADAERDGGQYQPAVDLADAVTDAQQGQLHTMAGLLE
ncbi:DUF305 domain-containing protein [Nocardioides sp. GXZ039]|uniref:DUF305 domain-containing protein n=1 Tax=Nocardioides sp. GXZ039 TaxID=3136018 RepID=UPI0030F3EC5A